MVENMKRVASSDQELTVEERNLLSVAYKNVIGARRASWRIVSSIEQKEESKGNDSQVTMIKKYREWFEGIDDENLGNEMDWRGGVDWHPWNFGFLPPPSSTGEKIEAELAQICEDILDVLDKHLIPSAASGESKVFYHKMWVLMRDGKEGFWEGEEKKQRMEPRIQKLESRTGTRLEQKSNIYYPLPICLSNSTGREITTVTLPNSLLVTRGRIPLTSL